MPVTLIGGIGLVIHQKIMQMQSVWPVSYTHLFPYTQQLGGEDFDIQEYLRGLFNTLLLHDVVARLKINDVTILQDIVRYIMANVGSLLSPNKIAKSLVSACLLYTSTWRYAIKTITTLAH